MRYLIILALISLGSCSMEKRCARAAKQCAPLWKTQKPDTQYIDRTIVVDSSHVDTVIHCDDIPVDTPLVIQKEEGKAKLTLRKTKDGKIKADCNCPEQEIIIQDRLITGPPVPVEVIKYPPWLVLLLILFFVMGVFYGFIQFSNKRRK